MKIPATIIRQLHEQYQIDISAFEESHHKATPVSIRLNPLKSACDFEKGNEVPWSSNAYYLKERPVFTADPLFHAGCYYVQEASSMFVEQAFKQHVDSSKKQIVLDACAAPGGKSTLLASLLNAQSLLVSNEVISTRVPVLVHNMAKWGSLNSVVTNNDPKDFSRLPDFFDVMMVDAPCSGSGLFRKQEDAIDHWSEDNVMHCSLRQQRILHDLLPSLKVNGILIYSTCSYSSQENEEICDFLMNEFDLEPLQIKCDANWGITETKSKSGGFGYRFFPHLAQGEGFFLTCFKKVNKTTGDTDGTEQVVGRQAKKTSKSFARNFISSSEQSALQSTIETSGFDLIKHAEEIVGYKSLHADEMESLGTLKIKKMPVHAGQLKGKDFIPHPYLAYQKNIITTVNTAEVDSETALKYLRKQPFTLSTPQKGFELITYKGHGLGWLKNLGNRVNNYYPAEWRILKEFF